MDPERMAELLRAAQEASRRGVPISRLNEEINKRTGGTFSDVRSLATAARDSGVSPGQLAPAQTPPEAREEASIGEKVGGAVRLATQGATLGFSDELGGLFAGAGAALVPGGEGFSEARNRVTGEIREGVEKSRQDLGLLGSAAEIGGAVAAPGGAAFKAASRVPNILARIGAGGLLGAAEGGAYGAGAAQPGRRTEGAVEGAKIGGLVGAAAPAAVPALRTVGKAVKAGAKTAGRLSKAPADAFGLTRLGRDTRRAEAMTGPRTADELRRISDVEGSPAAVRADIDEARKGLYKGLDKIDEIEDQPLREILQSEEVAPYVDEAVASGDKLPSFQDAQGAARQIRSQKNAALRSGDAASFQKLTNAERKVRRRLRDAIPEAAEADKAYASELRRLDALEAGDDFMKGEKTADAFEEAWRALGSEAEREAFREAAGTRVMARLDDIKGMKSTLERIQHGKETRRKLRIILGSDDALQEFTDVARKMERQRNRAKAARTLRRFILPMLGSAGLGGAAAGLLN